VKPPPTKIVAVRLAPTGAFPARWLGDDPADDRLAAESKQRIGLIDAAVGAYPTAQTHQVLGDLTLERVTESVEQALRDFIVGAPRFRTMG